MSPQLPTPAYLILCTTRTGLPYLAERDLHDTDWTTTVADIASGQVERVTRVLEVDLAAGTSRDVTAMANGAVDRQQRVAGRAA